MPSPRTNVDAPTFVVTKEVRSYIRDPGGYLIEAGQTTVSASPLDLYR